MSHTCIASRSRARRRSFTLARVLGLFAALCLPPAGALAQDAGAETVQHYAIPAGPLDQALNALARQAGLVLAVDGDLTAGKRSEAVQGRYTADEVLQRLLAGTGLAPRYTDTGTLTLVPAPEQDAQGPLRVGPIRVEGWRPSATRGYRPGVVSSVTKTEAAVVDVPVSVSVVTEEVIRDQNDRTVAEALRNVAGVGVGPNAANVSVQEEFTIRGFQSSLVRVNGVQRRSTGPLVTANIDSVEVLKGPFSVLYGDLSPGGFVNIQTKRPQREPAYELTSGFSQMTRGGTEGNASFDATGALDSGGRWLYRFIASAEGGSLFIDEADREQYFVAPSLAFIGLEERLRVDLDLSYLRNDETFLFGIPARNGRIDTRIGRDDFLGSDQNDKQTEDYNVELRTNLEVTPDTKVDAALTYHLTDHLSTALRPFGSPGQSVAADDTVRRSFSLRSFDSTDLQFETNLIHNVDTETISWRFLAGADARLTEFDHSGPGFGNIIDFDVVNVTDPMTEVALPALDDPRISFFARSQQTAVAWGAYVQAEAWYLDRIKLLAGVRYSNFYFEFEDASGFSFEEDPEKYTPRFGLLFKLTRSTSLYASYSTSFEQTFSFEPGNTEPLEAMQYEVGLKQELFGGRGLATVSLFDITQENLVTTDPNTGFNRQIGEAETQGIELELSGQVLPALQVVASYAYLDNEITKDNDGAQGNRLRNTPEHEASLWLQYTALERERRRLTIGGGVFYEGERFSSAQNGVVLPDYTTVDLTLGYDFESDLGSMRVQAGVKNLFDEEYFTGGFGEGIVFRGNPRTAYLQFNTRF